MAGKLQIVGWLQTARGATGCIQALQGLFVEAPPSSERPVHDHTFAPGSVKLWVKYMGKCGIKTVTQNWGLGLLACDHPWLFFLKGAGLQHVFWGLDYEGGGMTATAM